MAQVKADDGTDKATCVVSKASDANLPVARLFDAVTAAKAGTHTVELTAWACTSGDSACSCPGTPPAGARQVKASKEVEFPASNKTAAAAVKWSVTLP